MPSVVTAKYGRAKDELDFAGTLPLLTSDQREFLRTWIDRIHPGHAWSTRLSQFPAQAEPSPGR